MDELEISGRRYLSTKRAAKEHKYHSDYIGQLIRGKKVVGQKVGRSWYVDAESLEQYLNNEKASAHAQPAPAVTVAKVKPLAEVVEEKVVEEVIAPAMVEEEEPAASAEVEQKEIEVVDESEIEEIEKPEIIEIKKEEPAKTAIALHVVKEQVEEKTSEPIEREEPNLRGGLRYREDDAPLMPPLQKQMHAVTVMPRMMPREGAIQEREVAAPRRSKKIFAKTSTLIVAGGLALIIAAAVATLARSATDVSAVTRMSSMRCGASSHAKPAARTRMPAKATNDTTASRPMSLVLSVPTMLVNSSATTSGR